MSKSDLVEQRYQKLKQIHELGCNPYPNKYHLTHTIPELVRQFSVKSAEQLDREKVAVQTAGRVVAVRSHGKVSFAHLTGEGGRVQIYVRQDQVGEKCYQLYRLFDIGDIIGLQGVMFRTRAGELTIFSNHVDLLAKSLLPLPEKWHGLTDVELRYRQRYLDLIVNPRVRDIFIRRSKIISELRCFLETRRYLEVETPMMQPVAGGAAARPFKTFHEALGIPLFLRIAPELYLKRLVVGGFDRVFEINRSFRNEGISTQHNPEFTMLEFYQAYSDYWDLMDLTEDMLRTVVESVTGGLEVEFGDERINFDQYRRYSMIEAIQKFWPQDQPPTSDELGRRAGLVRLLKAVGVKSDKGESWGKLLGLLFEVVVEKRLIQPIFIYDFPVELSPLSKRKESDPRFVERFELFVAGLEIVNGYSELNDPTEQKRRFEEQLKARDCGDLEAHAMDEDYLRALCYGMPPTTGEGIGVDRLTMILTNSQSIREVIFFPQLRPHMDG